MNSQGSSPLSDSVSIVTGAGGGIGRACAELLAKSGGRVVLVDINGDQLTETKTILDGYADPHNSFSLSLDVSSEVDMQTMVDKTLDSFGRIDHLIACAGILRRGQTLKTVADTPLNEWEDVIRINLTGTFLSNRAVLPTMMEQKKGDIINISSVSGRQGRPFDGPYCASKFGIIGFSESLAEEVMSYGIRVQTILPDAVDTGLWEQNGNYGLPVAQALPPERVAELIGYLLSLPRDTFLLNPMIAPFKGRKKKRKARNPE